MSIRTLFIGTGDFAVTILNKLSSLDYVQVVGVITQPDKPVGRKQELTPGPLKQAILNNLALQNYKIFQPEKLRLEAEQIMNETQPDLIIVAAYGQMIPDIMLTQPKFKCLNLHGSLLPELRGAVPVQMSILQGLEKTGITIQRMVKELDAGPIVATAETELQGNETTESLMSRLGVLGADLLAQVLPDWTAGKLQEQPQDDSKATFCYQADIAKEKAEITSETDVHLAERMVRAFYPWPIAWVKLHDGKTLKIYSARYDELLSANVSDYDSMKPEGNTPFIMRSGKSLFLVLSNGVLELLEIQLEGKQRREAEEYLFLVA